MKASFVSWIGWLLIVSVSLFYLYYIYEAIALSCFPPEGKGPGNYQPVLAAAMGSIQALLLTNLGMLLGVSIANPNSNIARALKLGNSTSNISEVPPPMKLKEQIKLYALAIYILSLIACVIAWAVTKFSTKDTDVVPLIPESGKLFIGICIAYLAAVLKG